jgi:mono/diheme cytochrome c family protein/DNA-binding beta-propeller fold protein YncE
MTNVVLALPMALLSFGSTDGSEGAPKVPVALAWNAEGNLLVAEREGRGLSVISPETWKVQREWDLGVRPSSLAVCEDGTVVAGGMDGEVVSTTPEGTIRWSRRLGRGPTRVVDLGRGRLASVSLWDQAVLVLERVDGNVLARHSLGFAGGDLLVLPDGRLLVADAFGGRLAVLTPGESGTERVFQTDLVRLRGLASSPATGEILMLGLESAGSMPVSRSNVDWGLILSAKLVAMPFSELKAARTGRLVPRRLTLDGSGHGASDPSALAVTTEGSRILVALDGAHEILLVDRQLGASEDSGGYSLGDSQRLRGVEVGRNPTDVTIDPTGRFAITADAMSDTLTVLALDALAHVATIRLSPPELERPEVIRGEAAFRDGRASLDRWMSCASCHVEGHTAGLSFDTLGDGVYGNPKDTPSLLGVGSTAPFGWVGRFGRLEDQIDQSLRTSLHGPTPTAGQVAEIAAYLRSLSPAPPLRAEDDPAALRGREAFGERRCDACHVPPTFASRPLRDPWPGPGGERLSVPSLRGVARSAPYFHDARASTLDEALKMHHPRSEETLTPEELADIVAFLESL